MEILYILIIVFLIAFIIIIFVYVQPKNIKKAGENIFSFFLEDAWKMRVEWFKTLNKYTKPDTTVLVGDSLTNEYIVTEMLPDKNICNRGIGGDTSDGVLNRMSESIFDLNPKQMFLLIGTNDIQLTDSTNEKIVGNIKDICKKAKNFRKDMIINCVSITPISEEVLSHVDKNTVGIRTNLRIREINKLINQLTEEEGYNYINLYKFLANEKHSLRGEFTREGLHLSHLAYEKITIELAKLV